MHARISRAKIKPGQRPEIEQICARLRDENLNLPGVKYWMNFITDDDEVIIIGVFPTAAERDASAKENQKRWGGAAHLLEAHPTVTHGRMTQFLAL